MKNQFSNQPPVQYQSHGPVYADGTPATQQGFNQPQAYVAQPYQPQFQNVNQGYQQPPYQNNVPNSQLRLRQQQGQQNTVVIVQSRDVCSYCKGNLYVQKKVGAVQICACICLFFVCWPICWIPFVIEGCYEQQYTCAKCHSFNGRIANDY